jgi:hypothetical protein
MDNEIFLFPDTAPGSAGIELDERVFEDSDSFFMCYPGCWRCHRFGQEANGPKAIGCLMTFLNKAPFPARATQQGTAGVRRNSLVAQKSSFITISQKGATYE